MSDKFTKIADQNESNWKEIRVDKEHQPDKSTSMVTYAQLENRKAAMEGRKAGIEARIAAVVVQMAKVKDAVES